MAVEQWEGRAVECERTIGGQPQYDERQYCLYEAQDQDDEGLIEACHRVLLSV